MSKSTANIRYINLTEGSALAQYNLETCKRASALKDRIQIGAVGILMHVGKHNNKPQAVKLANDLIEGLGQGIQLKALIEWFVEFGLVINDSGKAFDDVNMDKLKSEFQRAKATHWVSFAPKTPWAGFAFDDKLVQLFKGADDAIKRAQGDADEAKVVSIDENKLAVLKMMASMSPEQLQAAMQALNMSTATTGESATITDDFEAGTEAYDVPNATVVPAVVAA
jgi:hypothetical protein